MSAFDAGEGRALAWFPKPFGPGDLDGVGAKRLLGTPSSDPAAVLVRETGQNSWDARGNANAFDFTLNLRVLRDDAIDVLRTRLFREVAPRTGLSQLLQRDEIRVLEIADRGTVGLRGPIRNDLAVDADESTDFIDLVFNIGARRDVHLGAGTYGFGKAITYAMSSVGTVLIWSRCDDVCGLEHRLIGSAIGDGFNMSGLRYTGRHWWGHVIPGEDRVEPVVGDLAKGLAERVFATHFSGDQTGTSILILDPQLGGDSLEQDTQLLVDAVVYGLWPKLVIDEGPRATMNIRIECDSRPVVLPRIEQHPVLNGHAHCLQAVRAAQSGQDVVDLGQYPIEVQEIWCNRPLKRLGHLAITRYPAPDQTKSPSHSVTLMRHQAELVVKYLELPELDVEGFQWAGVFKPVAEVDDSFALAEPPAHDDWIPQGIPDKTSRRDVNVALRRIREVVNQYVSSGNNMPESKEEALSAAHVGDMLSDLLVGLEGPAPSNRKTASKAEGKRRPRPYADIVSTTHLVGTMPGWTRTVVAVQLANGSRAEALVDVSIRVGIDGGSWDDGHAIRIVGWLGSSQEYDHGPQKLAPGEVRNFVYEARSDLAVDIETRAGAPT